jgi:hypothetical protein
LLNKVPPGYYKKKIIEMKVVDPREADQRLIVWNTREEAGWDGEIKKLSRRRRAGNVVNKDHLPSHARTIASPI